MAASASRYVEEIPIEHSSCQAMVDTWLGEEEHDGQSLQRERLELRADGKFTHSLSDRFISAGDASHGENESSCTGRWQLFNVRYLGADLSADGDRELKFEADAGSMPVLAEKIVVCGVNPQVNGFLGAACRLYPESQRNNVTSRRRERSPAVDSAAPDEAEPEISDIDVQRLAAATGRSRDECYAALLENNGDAETAAGHLLESGAAETEQDTPGTHPTDAKVDEVQAANLVDATGQPLQRCIEALQLHAGNADSAVLYLLGLPPPGDSVSSSSQVNSSVTASVSEPNNSARGSQDRTVDESTTAGRGEGGVASQASAATAEASAEAVQAARLAEVTGQNFKRCLEALRANGGSAESAVCQLLSIAEEPVVEPAVEPVVEPAVEPADLAQSSEADALQDTEDSFDGAFGDMENDAVQGGESLAAADVHSAVDAEVAAAEHAPFGAGAELDVSDEWGDTDNDHAPPYKRLRGSQDSEDDALQ